MQATEVNGGYEMNGEKMNDEYVIREICSYTPLNSNPPLNSVGKKITKRF